MRQARQSTILLGSSVDRAECMFSSPSSPTKATLRIANPVYSKLLWCIKEVFDAIVPRMVVGAPRKQKRQNVSEKPKLQTMVVCEWSVAHIIHKETKNQPVPSFFDV